MPSLTIAPSSAMCPSRRRPARCDGGLAGVSGPSLDPERVRRLLWWPIPHLVGAGDGAARAVMDLREGKPKGEGLLFWVRPAWWHNALAMQQEEGTQRMTETMQAMPSA